MGKTKNISDKFREFHYFIAEKCIEFIHNNEDIYSLIKEQQELIEKLTDKLETIEKKLKEMESDN